ncbi:uncharacterized protein LOC121898631 isoform X2 [Thunnus maccoyii]|uniref:uncharacterized protein LOC121898631 isoform X2 n=1 Tax=Thunnus maccoyii TaxID=8240 RepID=UPI001C4BAF79|nr:uncharacterized protein LOC121898631 isoform X2 [Thunnus maccoyii]
MQRGDAAATSDSFPPALHPSAPFLPSALPLAFPFNFPPFLHSSLTAHSSAAVPQYRLGAVLPTAAVQDVREADGCQTCIVCLLWLKFCGGSPPASHSEVFVDDINAGGECAIKGLCIYVNKDPEDLVQAYMVERVALVPQ